MINILIVFEGVSVTYNLYHEKSSHMHCKKKKEGSHCGVVRGWTGYDGFGAKCTVVG